MACSFLTDVFKKFQSCQCRSGQTKELTILHTSFAEFFLHRHTHVFATNDVNILYHIRVGFKTEGVEGDLSDGGFGVCTVRFSVACRNSDGNLIWEKPTSRAQKNSVGKSGKEIADRIHMEANQCVVKIQ
jgi:hypothetical protein